MSYLGTALAFIVKIFCFWRKEKSEENQANEAQQAIREQAIHSQEPAPDVDTAIDRMP